MQCPRCNVLLNEIATAGVLVDLCDTCHGLWLDRGELEKIARCLRELQRDVSDSERLRDARRPAKQKRWTAMFDIFD